MSTAARPLGVSRFVLAGAIAVLLVLLAAPAIVVLVTSGGGDEGSGERALRVGRQPTDVAVAGNTVWIASGRDDGIVALDGRRLSQTAARHETGGAPLRLAVGEDSVWTADAADDTVTRVNPLLPGSVGRRIPIGATRSTSPSVTTARG